MTLADTRMNDTHKVSQVDNTKLLLPHCSAHTKSTEKEREREKKKFVPMTGADSTDSMAKKNVPTTDADT